MEQRINEILHDLYAIDPSFRDREAEMKKIIEKLIGARPDTPFDEKFKQELLDKLLATYANQAHVRKPRLRLLPRLNALVGVAAAAIFIVAGFYYFQQDMSRKLSDYEETKKVNAELRRQIEELKILSKKTSGAVAVSESNQGSAQKKEPKVPSQAIPSQPRPLPAEVKSPANLYGTVALSDGSRVPGVTVTLANKGIDKMSTVTNEDGDFRFQNLAPDTYDVKFQLEGFKTAVTKGLRANPGEKVALNPQLKPSDIQEMVTVTGRATTIDTKSTTGESLEMAQSLPSGRQFNEIVSIVPGLVYDNVDDDKLLGNQPACTASGDFNTEAYNRVQENEFLKAMDNPLSTFAIDVDTASYANTRRFLTRNQMPPKDAVRIEEFINYFPYNYPQPKGGDAFSITTEASVCPWNKEHQLVLIGLRGRDMAKENLPPSNLVFLLDVSGSMDEPNKLPLVQQSMRLLLNELSARDRVAIVVYAGSAGLVLPSTPGTEKEAIAAAIERLSAGGSTAGGEGIQLAYKVAQESLIKGGNNRVILATDGDFNIGPSSDAEMERLIEAERQKGIFLTILGFGMDNLKDGKMVKMADIGNGNYAYIDSIMEAKKVLVNDVRKTLFTIAKDVKMQVEFNPARIASYRLIGYEKRLLKKEDFNDDSKDAGEIGAGHTVTALYEVVPQPERGQAEAQPLKYQQTVIKAGAAQSAEWLTVNIRYKKPDGDKSALISRPLTAVAGAIGKASETLRFATAVTEFAMILRDSKFKGSAGYEELLTLAKGACGKDIEGYRSEFLRLVEIARLLDKKTPADAERTKK